jgi:hypothetical protein
LTRLPEEEIQKGYPWWKRISLWFTLVILIFFIIYAIFW